MLQLKSVLPHNYQVAPLRALFLTLGSVCQHQRTDSYLHVHLLQNTHSTVKFYTVTYTVNLYMQAQNPDSLSGEQKAGV